MKFVISSVMTFFVMDIVSYYAHKYVFHGFLWGLHSSHHFPRKGVFEKNDFFSAFFATVAIVLMWIGVEDWFNSLLFGIGTGMTFYGFAYFFVHDAYTHRRGIRIEMKNNWLNSIRQLHRIHHQHVDKQGREPFGFIWFKL